MAFAQPGISSMPIDSLIVQIPAMMRSDERIARQMITRLAEQSTLLKHRHGTIQSIFFKAWLTYRHQSADMAISSLDSALKNIKGIESDTSLIKFYILKGQCFVKKAQFNMALQHFTKALDIAEKRNDIPSKTSVMISIGWAYMEDGKFTEALRFFNEVLQLNPSPSYDNRAVLLCNIASCYNAMGNFKLAEYYAQKGIEAARTKNSMVDIANGLNILARSYYQQGKMNKAIAYLKEASVAREKIAEPFMLASDYLELADLYIKNNQPAEAIPWAKKAAALSMQHASSLKLASAYETLADAYEKVGDDKNASLYLKKLLLHKDSLADDHYNQAMAEMQVQFDTQKKTAENLELKKVNLEATLKNSQQQRWLIILVGGLMLLLGAAIYTYYLIKGRYKIKLALEQLNEQKKRSMAVMEAEEKERKRIAADLHDGVCQTLAAASLQLKKARKEPFQFDKVDELINQAGTEVRNLSHQVTPELLLHYGLVKAMEQAIDRLNDSGDQTVFTLFTHIEKDIEGEMPSLMIYRCFQELTNNILKHAKASQVNVQLNLHEEEIQLMVEDDGVGFIVGNDCAGIGLKNIESRVTIYNGVFIMDSMPGKGSTAIIKFSRPLHLNGLNKTV